MNIKRLLAITLIITSLFSVSASAAVVDSATADNSSQYVTITGSLNVNKETEMSVTILNPGYTVADLIGMTDGEFSQVVNHFVQLTTAADGKYTASYKLVGSSGEYPVIINYAGGGEYATEEALIEFYALVDIIAALDSVNSAVSSGEIQSIVESKYKLLSISFTDYNELSSLKKKAVAEAFFSDKEALSDGFVATSDAAMSFEAHSAFYRIAELTDNAKLCEILERNSVQLGLADLNAHSNWNNLSDEAKLAVCSEILDSLPFVDIDNLKNIFSQRVVLKAVNSLSNWKGLKQIIKDNQDTLSAINLSKYFAITDSSSIDKALIQKTYTNISDFCTEVNKEVDKYKKPSSSPSTVTPGRTPSLPAYVPDNSGNAGSSNNEQSEKAFPFTDMEESSWAKEAVSYLYNAGIINGKSASLFAPDDLVTREEFAKMLVEAFSSVDTLAQSTFTDVNNSFWYAPYVATAFNKNIVLGMGDGSFGIGNPITRQDMCVMAYRAAVNFGGFKAQNAALYFDDNSMISDYAYESIGALYAGGIVKGVSADMFMPLENATRAQAAQVIYQLLKDKE